MQVQSVKQLYIKESDGQIIEQSGAVVGRLSNYSKLYDRQISKKQ